MVADAGRNSEAANALGSTSAKSDKGDFAKQANILPFSVRGMIYYPA